MLTVVDGYTTAVTRLGVRQRSVQHLVLAMQQGRALAAALHLLALAAAAGGVMRAPPASPRLGEAAQHDWRPGSDVEMEARGDSPPAGSPRRRQALTPSVKEARVVRREAPAPESLSSLLVDDPAVDGFRQISVAKDPVLTPLTAAATVVGLQSLLS